MLLRFAFLPPPSPVLTTPSHHTLSPHTLTTHSLTHTHTRAQLHAGMQLQHGPTGEHHATLPRRWGAGRNISGDKRCAIGECWCCTTTGTVLHDIAKAVELPIQIQKDRRIQTDQETQTHGERETDRQTDRQKFKRTHTHTLAQRPHHPTAFSRTHTHTPSVTAVHARGVG